MATTWNPSESQVSLVKSLRERGETIRQIAVLARISVHHVNHVLDPEYRAKQSEWCRKSRSRNLAGLVPFQNRVECNRASMPKAEEIASRLSERMHAIRNDYRNLTGVLLGDPLPTRSALYQRMELSNG